MDAFMDLHFDLKDIVAQGDKVAVSWIAKGTHGAPLRTPTGDSIPATNKKVTLPGCSIVEIRNSLITRQDIYWDQVKFLMQLEVPLEMLRSSSSSR
jgi:predicted ester cyclase